MEISPNTFVLVEDIVHEDESYVRVIDDEYFGARWYYEEEWCNRAMEEPGDVAISEELEQLYKELKQKNGQPYLH